MTVRQMREPDVVEPFDPDEIGRAHGELPPANAFPSSGPTFGVAHGAYTSTWPAPLCVSVELDVLRTDGRSGEVSGNIIVRSTLPGLERALHSGRSNLSSTRERWFLARHLTSRARNQRIDWTDLLEVAFIATLEAYRAGEPDVLLRDVPQPIDAGHLLHPVLLGRLPTIWFGKGGDGKSLLALGAVASVSSGRADLMGLRPAVARRCGYFDWEMDGWEHRERLRFLVGDDMPDVVYVRCRGALWEEADRLRRIIRDRELEYVVIDSVGMACGSVPIETSEAPQRFFDAMRSLEVGALCLAHKVKDETSDEYPFGSIFWHNNARATWLVTKQQELGEGHFVVGMFNKKANTGRLSTPLAFEIAFEEERCTISRRDVRDVPELADKVSLRWRLQHAFAVGPRLIADVAQELDEKPDSISRTLRRYAGRDFVRTSGADGVDRWANLARASE